MSGSESFETRFKYYCARGAFSPLKTYPASVIASPIAATETWVESKLTTAVESR
jgi:hypothetical protein